MEMTRTTYRSKLVRHCLCVCMIMFGHLTSAQPPVKKCTIKDGRMYIELGKTISGAALDSFIAQFDLYDLALKYLVKTKSTDSLKKLGWNVTANNKTFIISKSLASDNNLINPAQKILYTQKESSNIFPLNMGKVIYGFNRFKNKYPFVANGAVITFFLRNNIAAKKVMLAGSFTNWQYGAVTMVKTDSGWIARVRLDPGKHWYKFIIDGNWDTDNDNMLKENDGRGNVNSVFYKTNFIFKVDGFLNIRKMFLAGSFNNWRSSELLMNRTAAGWQLPLFLGEGTHTYKFVADGEWMTDRGNNKRLPDGGSGYNSVVQIGKPYIFKLNGYTNAQRVTVMGSFNNWRSTELYMAKTATGWNLPYTLGPGNYEYKFVIDGKQLNDPENPQTTGDTKSTGNSFLVIDPNYTFHLKGFNNAKTIFLAGDFNNWNFYSLPLKHEGDTWSVNVNLSPGKHQYKFITDGKWMIDPGNKLWEQNEFGTGNSVLWIEK